MGLCWDVGLAHLHAHVGSRHYLINNDKLIPALYAQNYKKIQKYKFKSTKIYFHLMNIQVDNIYKEVHDATTKAKNNKAPGLDGITYDVLKNDMALQALTVLFNHCLHNNIIPTTWSKGLINPIPKSASGDPSVPLNYKGISLLPVISKLYTGFFCLKTYLFWRINNMISIFAFYDQMLVKNTQMTGVSGTNNTCFIFNTVQMV